MTNISIYFLHLLRKFQAILLAGIHSKKINKPKKIIK